MNAGAGDRSAYRDSVLATAAGLRREFAETAAEIDREATLPSRNLARIHETGLAKFLIPPRWGGAATDDGATSDLDLLADILVEISAGESSTSQIWGVHAVVSRLIFCGLVEIDEGLQEQLVHEVLEEGVRFSNAAAEGGRRRRAFTSTATRKGDHFVVNGVKLFNTGSEGARYTIAPVISDAVGGGGLAYVLIPMNADGVRPHNDWDNMGQRATASGTITFENVTIPERFHLPIAGGPDAFSLPNSVFGLFFQMVINASILGMGFGAFDVACEYVREFARPNLPTVERPAEDPFNQWHVGRLSSLLASARALVREASCKIWDVERFGADRASASVHMMRAKFVVNEAALEATGQLHRLAGGRATSNKYRLDRFWRNARTLSVHDSIDAKLQQIGAFELDGLAPVPSMIS